MANGSCKAQTGIVDNKVRLECLSALVGLLGNLKRSIDAFRIYILGLGFRALGRTEGARAP